MLHVRLSICLLLFGGLRREIIIENIVYDIDHLLNNNFIVMAYTILGFTQYFSLRMGEGGGVGWEAVLFWPHPFVTQTVLMYLYMPI